MDALLGIEPSTDGLKGFVVLLRARCRHVRMCGM